MKTKVALILVLLTSLLLVGCTAHYVDDGTLRDTIFSVEKTENGYWRVWMTHDDIAGYCTDDNELGIYALSLLQEHDGEVLIEFESIRYTDEEYSWWDSSDCGNVNTGSESYTAMFLMTSITPVDGR